ncbi:MAG: ATP-dependent Clp protease proteolytic subunit [Lachnospiraceae bacterium]|nr:ATP-dependent Clp protease proteolytic subunit [Lachnospiraceae bacterium]
MDELMEYVIPKDLSFDLVNPVEYNYWKARKNRTFYIDYILDEGFDAVELAKTIIQINAEEKDIPEEDLKPVFIWIYTPGGDAGQCDMLCDIIESSRIPIVTINMGMAMSSGFFIFLAGKRRYCFEKAVFMVHDGYLTLQGTSDQVDAAHKNYKKELDKMKKYVIKHTSIDEKLFNKNKGKDWYVEGHEIETLGIAKIVKSFDEIV